MEKNHISLYDFAENEQVFADSWIKAQTFITVPTAEILELFETRIAPL